MRFSRLLLAVPLLLSAAAASAQSTSTSPWRLTLFASDIGYTQSSSSGSNVSGSLGVGLSYAHNERWSTELAVSADRHQAPYTAFVSLGDNLVPYTTIRDLTTYPIELTTRYSFLNRSRWSPFVLAGMRHVQAPAFGSTVTTVIPGVGQPAFVARGFSMASRTSAEAGVGVVFHINDRVGLQLDARHLLREQELPYDPLMRVGVGVTWRF